MESTGLEPANADNKAPVETAEVDSEAVGTEGADPAPAAAETGKPDRDKVQERFDRLTREKYEGLSRAERAEYRAQELERRLAERDAAEAKTETVAPSDEFPTLESCGYDEGKLRVALDAYYEQKAANTVESALAKREREAQQRQAAQTHERREVAFIKAKPDYAEKALRHPSQGGPVITDQMAEVIRASDIGPEVAYYLGENVEKSFEIARLPANLQAREIGRIEARLEAAKANPVSAVSKAPPPVAKVEANASVDKDPSNMSDAEFAKWRGRQIAQRGSR